MITDDTNSDTCDEPLDVIIVGAGPCGLAVAARLREKHPSALFTDEEQARYAWIKKHANRAAIKHKRNGKITTNTSTAHNESCPSMLILDSSADRWMSKWDNAFKTLDIQHLRSPMFFHPDPSDRDALLAYTYGHERTEELREISGCGGKERSKHRKKKDQNRKQMSAHDNTSIPPQPAVEIDRRDHKDYFSPSTACFRDFCEACQRKYNLHKHVVHHETVRDIEYGDFSTVTDQQNLFRVATSARRYLARCVVLAVGAGKPCIPEPFPEVDSHDASHVGSHTQQNLLSGKLKQMVSGGNQTNVLIIGGGLTSAQLAHTLLQKGVGKVHMLIRGQLKVKPFDVDLSWMSKCRNHQRAAFWTEDDLEERMNFIKTARGGGSITPQFKQILDQHIKAGLLEIHCHTIVANQTYSTSSKLWTITTQPSVDHLPAFDHIYFATGTQIDVNTVPCLHTLNKTHQIKTHYGLPQLDADLRWREDVPLFVTGRLAMLHLGPGAGNLEGARLGAERIAWAIEENRDAEADPRRACKRYSNLYVAGEGSKFDCLLSVDNE